MTSRASDYQRLLLCSVVAATMLPFGCGSKNDHQHQAKTIHSQRAGAYTVSLVAEAGHVGLGTQAMRLEVRDAESGQPASVGPVTISWSHADSSGPARRLELQPKSDGRYDFVWDLWSGRWNVAVEWNGARTDFVLDVP